MPTLPSDTVLRFPPETPTPEDAELARRAIAALTPDDLAAPKRLALSAGTVAIPPPVLRLMATALSLIAQGREVDAFDPAVEVVTTQEAADRIGVSRPYLIKQIETGTLRCYWVGAHRRVFLADVLRLEETLRARRSSSHLERTGRRGRRVGGGSRGVVTTACPDVQEVTATSPRVRQ